MAEFFKAAVKCDVKMAKAAPMYIDQTAVLEELYKHDRLVEQTLRTRQFLEQIEAAEEAEKSLDDRPSRIADQLLGNGTKVLSPYKEPPTSDEAKAKHPTERNEGSRAIQRGVENRLSLWRKDLDNKLNTLNALERSEKERDDKEREARARDAERELNALVMSRQIAAHEAQQEVARQQMSLERSNRRVHPIDVLQKKIAVDLMDETQKGALQVAAKIAQDARGIDQIVEAEQLRSVKYQYHHPVKHIPHPW